MRIGLNLLHARPEIGGAWNYIASLLEAIGQWDEENDYFAFTTPDSDCLVPARANFTRVLVKLDSISRPRRILYENLDLQRLALRHRLDLMHWFGNTQALFPTVPGYVTIYDLMSLRKPEMFGAAKRLYLRLMIPYTATRSRFLLPISQATAAELATILHVPRQRMVVVPLPLRDCFRPAAELDCAALRAKYNLPERFWLYVAHFYQHKNHLRLVEAYHNLKVQGLAPWPLVLRGDAKGMEDAIMQRVADLDLAQDVVFLPRITDAELPLLFSAATALIFPSLYEGLGIPVVEAMACGCPVVASQIPSIQEYAHDAVTYVDPSNVGAIAAAMAQLQADGELRASKRQAGLRRSADFTSQAVVSTLLGAYGRLQSRV